MATLYVTSIQTFSGKSILCVGLAKRFIRDGFSFAYMKPISTIARVEDGEVVDDDALFFKRLFDLPQSVSELVPVALTPQTVEAILRGTIKVDFEARLRKTCWDCSSDKDVLLLEGGGSLREGYIVGLSTPYVADLLNAKELVVIKYDSDLTAVDDALVAKRRLGDTMLGVVLNMVPRPRLQFVEEVTRAYLEKQGIKVFAVLPQDRVLASTSVGELVEVLEGDVLCCPEGCNELVEYIMIGAMTIETALSHFRRKANKAVITGGDRPDIQLAALETPTKCIILTGNLYPSPIILSRAEELGIPIILVRYDTFTTVQLIEQSFGKSRFYQERKIAHFERLLDEHFDFQLLYEMLGLKTTRSP
jgi:hypothetical protein